MSKKLCLVGCHVDVHGTIALAAFARQAEIECLFYVLITPAAMNRVAVHHFP
jgi:hypothetical protein